MTVTLTPEQQAIVEHDLGPALVFAVAGAGKSTAAAHRVERLVREQIFPAEQVLMTTFNRSAAQELRSKLRAWPYCSRVAVTTLHSVGYRIIRRAQRRGHLDDLHLGDGENTHLADVLFSRAMGRARADGLPVPRSVDREDFLAYVSRAKGQLQYADLSAAKLPPAALKVATQALNPAPGSIYLELYRVFEQERARAGIITFDDMLVLAWEALLRHPDVLADVQGQYACVLVDEFQDVNLAQSELLDLITRTHGNLMAIGDDDQTIYEWRGASVEFILNFERRYGATTYLIQDNFRSPAPHLVLANAVIRHNLTRREKQLQPTRGFSGGVAVHRHGSAEEQAAGLVQEISARLHDGERKRNMAVLLRRYAQTPFIEHFLIRARVPYVIRGSLPFYERPELLVLLSYLRVGACEARLRAGHAVPDEAIEPLKRSWDLAVSKPTRYLKRELTDRVFQQVIGQHLTFSRGLQVLAAELSGRARQQVAELADVVRWLGDVTDDHLADAVLTELEARLGYMAFLRESTGMPETAEARATNVLALIEFARGKGSAAQLLTHLEFISFQRLGRGGEDAGEDVVVLSTVHRAKGAEWPVVFVPDCNAGTYPMGGPAELEAERRLFYVALTRAKRTLHLHSVKGAPLSPFLVEVDADALLGQADRLAAAVTHADPDQLTVERAVDLLQLPAPLGLERYLLAWWPAQAGDEHVRAVARAALSAALTAQRLNLPNAQSGAFWTQFGVSGNPDRFLSLPNRTEPPAPVPKAAAPARLDYGERVIHAEDGPGTILIVETLGTEQMVTVHFDVGGKRRLLARTANLRRLAADSS